MYSTLWVILHELGHIISTFIMNVKIRGVGIRLKPILHIYVEIDNSESSKKKYIFTISGVFVIFLLWAISSFIVGLNKFITITLSLQLIMDINPFYSDTQELIAMIFSIKNRQSNKIIIGRDYLFSNVGIIHFLLWGGVICMIIIYIKRCLL